ncbi:hypothetical protein CBER1_05974 [Cercospora berteroae]|uniref:Myb-like domain-containing protein n=1 Tax=Cercospora berteroae TaxID=357750 RepID=A0A2S6CAV1_9PEZI|nr:hypothetical protein CBER1_05974 [Cercospora berteroae]
MLLLRRGIRVSHQILHTDLRTVVARRWNATASDDLRSEGEAVDDLRRYKVWTAEEERKLLELRASGLISREIGRELKRATASVRRRFWVISTGDGVDKSLAERAQELLQRRKPWTPVAEEERVQVEKLRNQNYSRRNIAAKLGMTIARVNYLLAPNKRGTGLSRYTAEEDAMIVGLMRDGQGWDEIRARLPHRSRNSLYLRWQTICHKHAFWHRMSETSPCPPKTSQWTDEDTAQLKRLYEQGTRVRDIAKRVGRTPTAVRLKMFKLRMLGEAEHSGQSNKQGVGRKRVPRQRHDDP